MREAKVRFEDEPYGKGGQCKVMEHLPVYSCCVSPARSLLLASSTCAREQSTCSLRLIAILHFPSGPSPGLLEDSSDILIQPILIDFILNPPAVTFLLTY
jgi:hypothetical protein